MKIIFKYTMLRNELENVEYRIDAIECLRYSDILLKDDDSPSFPFCLFQKVAEQEDNPHKSKILWLLADILSLEFDNEQKDFLPMCFFRLENLSEKDVDFLTTLLNEDIVPYIKARIADVLFCKTKQFRPYVDIAINSYLKMPIGSKNWNLYMQDAWQRAIFLVQTRAKKRTVELKNLFFGFVRNASNNDVEPIIWTLIYVFEKSDLELHPDVLDTCVKVIRYYIPRISFSLIRYWSVAFDKIALVNHDVSDSLYEELINDRLPYFEKEIKRDFYVRACEINRLIPLLGKMSKNKRAELQDKEQWMIKKSEELYRKAMQFEFRHYSEYADLERRKSIENFFSKSNPALLFVHLLKSIAFNEKTYESIIKAGSELKNGLTYIAGSPMNVLNANGSIVSSNWEDASKNLLEKDCVAKEFQKYVFKQSVECLEPIFIELTKKCCLTYGSAKEQLLTHSSYLNETNVSAFAKGWIYGIQGDVYAALHLMVPHFDRILLDFLKEKDVPVMGRNKNTNVDFEKSPGNFLELNESVAVLGREQAFQIKMIFYSELGFNYRNRIAHGQVNDAASEQIYMRYAWTFILKFLLDKVNL
ncbi:MAG: DUF4209 domain-containing protein [Fibrobacter sp.]|nr:DUF4209 domain-containing protein [Fibrobacter sp.]